MKKKNIPVLLLTGYLGSGKTTLLNRILTNERGIRFAVIVNDIGEVNIDASLIQKGGVVNQADDSLVALQNGCICCTLKMDLVEQLHDIIATGCFDYIVIEASGICEPGPIAQTICSIPQMEPRYTEAGVPVLDSIVTVVDALRMKDEFGSGSALLNQRLDEDDLENLVIQQIEFCTMILLNKAAEVEPDELERIRQIVRTIQPRAEIIDCNYGDVPLELLLNTGAFDFERVATSAAWIHEIEKPAEEDDHDHEDNHHHHSEEDDHNHEEHHHEEHGHHHHHHHEGEGEALEYGIATFVYYRREPMDLGRFDEFVARHWPKNIIRAKGVCYFHDERDTCYVFEQAGRQVSIKNAGQWYATMPKDELEDMLVRDATLRHDWDEYYGDRMQKIVFIGQKMDRKAIEEALDKCLR
ncbi:MAG: GTP-binding protein [Bacteroidaceae bacterium]|nr:GTP-binding protein [Bacteroidaceae bacterium]